MYANFACFWFGFIQFMYIKMAEPIGTAFPGPYLKRENLRHFFNHVQ